MKKNEWRTISLLFSQVCVWIFPSLCEENLWLHRFSGHLDLHFHFLPPTDLRRIFSTEQASSLTQLWIHWKRLSIMTWSDYLVVRLLTHSHHYITVGSLWNYSAIYHSLLHSPYTLNDRLLLNTRCLTRLVKILAAEYLHRTIHAVLTLHTY